MESTGEDKAAFTIIHSWLLLCFYIAHYTKTTIERDFWNAVLFKVSCLEFTLIPWKCMAPHYWNTAFFLLYTISISLFYTFCALEKILLSLAVAFAFHLTAFQWLSSLWEVSNLFIFQCHFCETHLSVSSVQASAWIWKLRYKQIDSIKRSLSSHRQFPPICSRPSFLQFIQQNHLLSSE